MVAPAQKTLARRFAPVIAATLGLAASPAWGSQRSGSDDGWIIRHAITATLNVDAGGIEVVDTVTLPEEALAQTGPTTVVGALHTGLSPTIEGATLKVTTADAPGSVDLVATDGLTVTLPAGSRTFTLRYQGTIAHPIKPLAGEQARGFSSTPGIISDEGVYLARSSAWLFGTKNARATFTLEVKGLPDGWRAVSEGTASDDGRRYESQNPVDEVHLVAGPFARHKKTVDGVVVEALLRTDDRALANRYLEVTGQYLRMYTTLFGAYPWDRFSLVENFWETGYGMPGFTLLGQQVIRFPFILHSSYPHELLHNWWGNGVYIPLGGDNWAEGLTAYFADHLVAEQRGQGALYRRRVLAKFKDFVTPTNDFPLRTFSGRFSPASEAIGYGKWMMVLHMVRNHVGDDAFLKGLKAFYTTHKYQRATFVDLERALSESSGKDLKAFFSGWLDTKGAPRVRWSSSVAQRRGGRWSVALELSQTPAMGTGGPYPLVIPVYVTLDDARVERKVVTLFDQTNTVELSLSGRPARVDIDPLFESFRALDPKEVPPAMSAGLGAEKRLFVLPADASGSEKSAWRAFAKALCGGAKPPACRIVDDKEAPGVPADTAVWVLGYGNLMRAAAAIGAQKVGAGFDDYFTTLDGQRINNGKHAVALALPHPTNAALSLTFVGAHDSAAIPGLARKLPHYGKYGYLAFDGQAPDNRVKGQWAPSDSPLSIAVRPDAPDFAPPRAEPLAKLPPPFEADRMLALVRALADPSLAGRGYGSPGLEKAQARVEEDFASIGLKPWGAPDFRRCWIDDDGPNQKRVNACNVIGALPGEDASLPAVVVSAHVDHIGRGWPDARKGDKGKIHPGADDNASGVAVLIEVARALASQGPFARTVVFAAFTGEEAGLRGSRHFVSTLGDAPADSVMAVVNLDTVGRRDGKFVVFGHESAREWRHVFMGIGFVSGVETDFGAAGIQASDHVSFVDKGIPGVQLFGSAHADFHRPTDTADKVSGASLVDAAVITREAAAYLADRKEPLTANGQKPAAKRPTSVAQRSVSFGLVPDFKFAGPGVRVFGVGPGTPAEKAGIQKGDILVGYAGSKVANLRHFAGLLRRGKPGQTIAVTVERDGKPIDVEVTLTAR